MGLGVRVGTLEAAFLLDPQARARFEAICRRAGITPGDAEKKEGPLDLAAVAVVDRTGRYLKIRVPTGSASGIAVSALLWVALASTLGAWNGTLVGVGIVVAGFTASRARQVVAGWQLSRARQRSAEAATSDESHWLKSLAELARSQQRHLRMTYTVQLIMGIIAYGVMIGILCWSVYAAHYGVLPYNKVLGGGSVAGLVLTRTLWQPFRRAFLASKARHLLEVELVILTSRLASIHDVPEPERRAALLTSAAAEYREMLSLTDREQ